MRNEISIGWSRWWWCWYGVKESYAEPQDFCQTNKWFKVIQPINHVNNFSIHHFILSWCSLPEGSSLKKNIKILLFNLHQFAYVVIIHYHFHMKFTHASINLMSFGTNWGCKTATFLSIKSSFILRYKKL